MFEKNCATTLKSSKVAFLYFEKKNVKNVKKTGTLSTILETTQSVVQFRL